MLLTTVVSRKLESGKDLVEYGIARGVSRGRGATPREGGALGEASRSPTKANLAP